MEVQIDYSTSNLPENLKCEKLAELFKNTVENNPLTIEKIVTHSGTFSFDRFNIDNKTKLLTFESPILVEGNRMRFYKGYDYVREIHFEESLKHKNKTVTLYLELKDKVLYPLKRFENVKDKLKFYENDLPIILPFNNLYFDVDINENSNENSNENNNNNTTQTLVSYKDIGLVVVYIHNENRIKLCEYLTKFSFAIDNL
jgi:hypothetical protein